MYQFPYMMMRKQSHLVTFLFSVFYFFFQKSWNVGQSWYKQLKTDDVIKGHLISWWSKNNQLKECFELFRVYTNYLQSRVTDWKETSYLVDITYSKKSHQEMFINMNRNLKLTFPIQMEYWSHILKTPRNIGTICSVSKK